MEIVGIYPPYLYAVKYSDDNMDIYRLTIKNLTDDEYLEKFYGKFQDQISDFLVKNLGIPRDEIEEYEAITNDQMIDIYEDLRRICKNIREKKISDFDGYFKPHSPIDFPNPDGGGGKSQQYGVEYLPVKCYGSERPPLVRLYAIELTSDCYLIIFGGIKITRSTNDCPAFGKNNTISTLENELRDRIEKVCNFLEANKVIDNKSLIDYLKEDHE